MIDSGMWGNEAKYVLLHDSREFDFLQAYGHPGGPIIEGTVVLSSLFNFSYENSVLIFVTLFDSLIIAGICALALTLRKKSLWWIAVFGTVVLNRLYDSATPPTAVATVLVVFLCLLTLYIIENKERMWSLALWGGISGLAAATRADIGVFSSAVFLLLLLPSVGWRKIALIIGEAILVFVALDPFMWFMPIRHIQDLIFKMVYHYAEFAPNHLNLSLFIVATLLSLISMFLCIQFLLLRKKMSLPLPPFFMGALLLMTGVLYTIFFTSHYQAIRYFLPTIFIWELFLPLFIFSLIDHTQFSFAGGAGYQFRVRKILKWSVVALILFYHLLSIAVSLFIKYTFHAPPL